MSFYPQQARPMQIRGLSGGKVGTEDTLKTMKRLALLGARDPGVIQVASELVRNLPQYDRIGEVKALHGFVRDSIRYTSDPLDFELVRDPKTILQMGVGDCDDKSVLLACLLRCVGHPSRFVAVWMRGLSGYSHVYVETPLGRSKWVPLETIKPVEVGWGPSNVLRRMTVHL